ncbi:MAG: DMT family transporter, partial [Ignavibacteria bacterium]|nr:DMT family transporter [Ignavibacteria bacterium]
FMSVVGMLITVLGIILVVSERKNNDGKRNNQIGILFAIISTLGQSVGLIFAKQAFSLGEINGFVSAFVRIFSSVIILLPITFFLGKFKNPIPIFIKDKTALLLTASGAFFGPYLGITLSLVAVAHTDVGIAATIMGTVPIIMLPLVKYFYKERLSWKAIVGAFIAVIGVAILFMKF